MEEKKRVTQSWDEIFHTTNLGKRFRGKRSAGTFLTGNQLNANQDLEKKGLVRKIRQVVSRSVLRASTTGRLLVKGSSLRVGGSGRGNIWRTSKWKG